MSVESRLLPRLLLLLRTPTGGCVCARACVCVIRESTCVVCVCVCVQRGYGGAEVVPRAFLHEVVELLVQLWRHGLLHLLEHLGLALLGGWIDEVMATHTHHNTRDTTRRAG
jgi:hypothetical protein